MRPIKHRIVKTRFGYYCHTTHGVGILEGGMFSFTRRGIERKAARLTRKLRRDEQAWQDATVIDA